MLWAGIAESITLGAVSGGECKGWSDWGWLL